MDLSLPQTFAAHGHIDEIDYIDLAVDGSNHRARRIPKGSILTVSGWATMGKDAPAPAGVYVRIDDRAPLEARYGLERPDVAASMNSAAFARCGFVALCSTDRLAPGEHTLTLSVRDPAGRLHHIAGSQTFSIDVTDETLVLEAPSNADSSAIHIDEVTVDGRSAGEPLRATAASVVGVRGWAVDRTAGSVGQSVFAVIGTTAVRAQYGIPRDDVAREGGVERYRGSGFAVNIPLAGMSAGEHEIAIRLVGADGATVNAGPTIRIDIQALSEKSPPRAVAGRAFVDEVLVLGGGVIFAPDTPVLAIAAGDLLLVRGWALDRTNERPAAGIVASIAGAEPVPAMYGLERGDVAAAFGKPQLAACGFTLLLPTRPPGDYKAEFWVIEHDGGRTMDALSPLSFSVAKSP